jgi:multiple sugar transport system permease protein
MDPVVFTTRNRNKATTLHLSLRKFSPYLYVIPAYSIIVLIYSYPIIYNVILSFQRKTLATPVGVFIGLAQFVGTLSSAQLWTSFKILSLWLVGTLPFIALFGVGLALLLNQKVPGIAIFRGLLFVPWIVPDYIASIIFRWLFDPLFGIINFLLNHAGLRVGDMAWFSSTNTALVAVIILGIWKATPFITLLCLAGLQDASKEIYEAATVDGANRIQKFLYLTIPHLAPVFSSAMLLMTIWMANTVTLIYVATKGGPINSTTTTPIYIYNAFYIEQNFGHSATISVIYAIVIMTFTSLVISRVYNEK